MATIFLSPGVYTKEQDFTVFASRLGITRLGLVGKTEKGPAFEAIKISSADEYALRFGTTKPEYPLSYVAHSFLAQANDLTISRVLGTGGFTNSPAWLITVNSASTQYSGATLAILRSKQTSAGVKYFDEVKDVIIGAVSGMSNVLSDFVISGSSGPLTAYTNSGFTVSLDETKDNYIVKVFGKNPKVVTDTINLYVEEIYPHFIREAVERSMITGTLSSGLVYKEDGGYVDYTSDYTHSTTPWIVSRVVGGQVHRLFKFHTISDGDSSAKEIKISIANIDVNNYTFDVIVRRFEDTDATAGSTALESFNVTLDETASNYIGKSIGTWDEEYPSKSMFITVELANRFPENSVPAGFEGYNLRGIEDSTSAAPDIFYKTTYLSGDSIFKTYLGISELAYTSLTSNNVSVKNSVKSIESDLFVYHGDITSSAITITKGFHMENTADATQFVSGEKSTLTAYTKTGLTDIIDKAQLKFTVVPAGGFDGFNKYKTFENPYEEFMENESTNYQNFKDACDIFATPEETDINLFATPGVDFKNNTGIIKYALSMIEDRSDALYLIDAPRVSEVDGNGVIEKGTPEEVVSNLESTGIDSNYAATYWPWVQIEDSVSGKYIYQAPTLLVVKSIAFTDNVSDVWNAPAGLLRGSAGSNIKRTDIKLNKAGKDTLYSSRINPIVSEVQHGISIWGQKTLQVRQSALDRINIRRLILQLRRLVAAASLTLVFEQNDQTLRDQFLAKVEPILLQMQNRRAISAFKVVMDDSNNTSDTIDRNMLIGKIQVKPVRTAEFIDLTFQVLPTQTSFDEF